MGWSIDEIVSPIGRSRSEIEQLARSKDELEVDNVPIGRTNLARRRPIVEIRQESLECVREMDAMCLPIGELAISIGELEVPIGELSLPTGELSLPIGELSVPIGEFVLSIGELGKSNGRL